MYLALTYDHRILDGREAVTFSVKIKVRFPKPSGPRFANNALGIHRGPKENAACMSVVLLALVPESISTHQHPGR